MVRIEPHDLADAYAMAARWHRDQTDSFDGTSYLTHVFEVARLVRPLGPAFEVVGVLHDTIEDTELSLDEIAVRFGPEIATAVDAMTKREGEDYFGSYMPRVLADPYARAVKCADAHANLAKTLRHTRGEERLTRSRKYMRAIALTAEFLPNPLGVTPTHVSTKPF